MSVASTKAVSTHPHRAFHWALKRTTLTTTAAFARRPSGGGLHQVVSFEIPQLPGRRQGTAKEVVPSIVQPGKRSAMFESHAPAPQRHGGVQRLWLTACSARRAISNESEQFFCGIPQPGRTVAAVVRGRGSGRPTFKLRFAT